MIHEQRVALVTGGTRGIGAAIAERLGQDGHRVVVVGRRTADSADAASTKSGAHVVTGDISRESDVARLVEEVVDRFGRVDVLVNSAGEQESAPILDMSVERWDQIFAVNARGAFLCTQAVARVMIAGGSGGSIVNIASTQAHVPVRGRAAYAASKAALVSFTRAASGELGEYGIRVNAISPGLVDRPGLREAWPVGVSDFEERAALGRIGTPTDIASAVSFLASEASGWITGTTLVVDGGRLATSS